MRGGSWSDPASESAASYRDTVAADATAGNVGFRIVQTELVKTRRAPAPRTAPGITIP